jgi:twitching motility protein PilT
LRVHGAIRRVNLQPLDGPHLQQSLLAVMPALQACCRGADCDFALALPGLGRFRIHAFHQQRGPAAAIRPLRQEPPALPELGAPGACAELAMRAHGLVLVSGPTGSGKSSTLAAMVRLINETRPVHILTSKIRSNSCTRPSRPVSQREIGTTWRLRAGPAGGTARRSRCPAGGRAA